MPMPYPISYTCACGASNNVVAERSWRADEFETLRRLINNEFHRYECTSCRRPTRLEVDMMVMSHQQNWVVQVILDPAMAEGAAKAVTDNMPAARMRIVPNRLALVERVSLFTGNIDDVAYELARFQERTKRANPGEQLLFNCVDGNEVVLAVVTGGRQVGEVVFTLQHLAQLATQFETARYARDQYVDEGLAKRMMDARL